MKILIIAMISVVLMLNISCDSCSGKHQKDTDANEIQLVWKADSIGSLFIEKSHLVLPFNFNDYPQTYMLGLRLDFEGSFLFEEAVNNLMSEVPNFDIISDDNQGLMYIENISGIIDKYKFENKTLPVKRFYSTEADDITGFIDLSFFKNSILKINFSEEKIKVLKNNEDEEIANLNFEDFEIINGKIYVNVNINNMDYKFRLVAESRVYALFNTSNITDSDMITIINSQTVNNPALFYTPSELIEQENIEGIIGSSFLEKTCLFLDLENHQFAFVILE